MIKKFYFFIFIILSSCGEKEKVVDYESFLKQEFEYVAQKLDISVDELQKLFDSPIKTYRNYKNKRGLIRFGASIMRKLQLEKRYF